MTKETLREHEGIASLVDAMDWDINEQNFVNIPGTNRYMSIVPMYSNVERLPNGRLETLPKSNMRLKLNCCIREYGKIKGIYEEYDTETEWYNAMIHYSTIKLKR